MRRDTNLKRYIDECVRRRARRVRRYALLGVLCALVALGVTGRLMKPAITATAQPECGREEHVHGQACYERTLTCGLDEGEGHAHAEACFASVLSCGKQEHTHDDRCYPSELPEQTLVPEATAEPEAAPETAEPDVTAEPDATAEPETTLEPEATAAPETTLEPDATAEPETTLEPDATAEPETTLEPDATAGPEDGQVSLDPLDGPVTLRAGEEGVWEAHAACAERLTYEVTNEQGETIAQGDVSEGTVRLAIDRSGLYLLCVTAHSGEAQAAQCLNLAVSDGELVGGVTASLSCFGGDEAAFDLHFEGGVQPVSCRVSIWQDGELLWEGEAQDAARALTRALETVSEVTAKAVWTDACGQIAQAEAAIPCAVRKIETRAEWERSFAGMAKTGEWPKDLLELARTQLGYKESAINFVVNEKGERRGYTRYGDWYGNDHAAWCAMFVSFCLHYADVPEAYFPVEANCGRWIRDLKARSLYLRAGEYEPQPGDLVFFDWEGDGVSDHVGLVEKAGGKLYTIEGNKENRVMRAEYELNDRAICGYGTLNGAYQRALGANATETPLPEESMEPAETPLPEESMEPAETPAPEESAEPVETPLPEESMEPTETPLPEESMEPAETPAPEQTLEPGTDEWNRLAARISALEIPAGDAGEDALAQYDAALQETLGAVLSARENGAIDEREAVKLLEALVLRQAGGESARFAALRESISGLKQPAEDAPAGEKVEYDAALSALRERIASAYQAGEIAKCEYSLLQRLLEQAPRCPVQCAYAALDGAVRVVHAESGELGQETLTARVIAPGEQDYARCLQELSALLAPGGEGIIAQAMLLEIGFTGEGGAQVTLRLTGETAEFPRLLVAHRGENGWEWLESERLTGEGGAAYVTFRAQSFSPFAVVGDGARLLWPQDRAPEPADARRASLSDGPVFLISARLDRLILPAGTREAPSALRAAPRAPKRTNIKTYVESNNGTFTITLLNPDNTEPEKDEHGNYIVTVGQEYRLTLGISAPNGIAPGEYEYDLPAGLTVSAGSGQFVVNGVTIGTWSVDANGHVELHFYEHSDNYTHVTISAGMGVTFSESENPIDFDGQITVVVNKPPQGEGFTLKKRASFIEVDGVKTQIRWTVEVKSESSTSMAGKTITDGIQENNTGNHHYTDIDKAAGVLITAAAPDGTEYQWKVYGSGDGLTWTEHGWQYVFPEQVVINGQTVALGKGWNYTFSYTTTICDTATTGIVPYRNTVTSGGVKEDGYISQNKGGIGVGDVDKDGQLNGDMFHWQIEAELGGWSGEGKYTEWKLYDWLKIKDSKGNSLPDDLPHVGREEEAGKGDFNYNRPENLKVTLQRNGDSPILLKSCTEAGADDPYAYQFEMGSTKRDYSWWLRLMMRCQCTAQTCTDWSSSQQKCRKEVNGWCTCWRERETVQVVIEYDTPAQVALERYGGVGNKVRNSVELYTTKERMSSDLREVVVPGAFKKTLSQQPGAQNEYTAAYTVTVNEGHLDLSGQQTLVIEDQMSETLVYVPGTLAVTATDTGGSVRTLKNGADYTSVYYPERHMLAITVNHPGTDMYTLTYDAQIVIPEGATNVTYHNKATITLFGKNYTSETKPTILADITFAAKRYQVTVQKTDLLSEAALPGATFGLFTKDGLEITRGETGADGRLTFQTNVTAGVILKQHTPYYIQELSAPKGYELSDKKHWLVFCDGAQDDETCKSLMSQYSGMIRVPAQEGAVIPITNRYVAYELPQTGGSGMLYYSIGGLALMAISLLFGGARKRKGERGAGR